MYVIYVQAGIIQQLGEMTHDNAKHILLMQEGVSQ